MSSSQFSMPKLLKATQNFSPDMIIGHGDSFLLYKAHLSNGLTVAVKKLDPREFPGFREFRAEAQTLGKLLHPNIIKLLGYSSDGHFVYEYIERGDLQCLLHDSDNPLPWSTRLGIVRGVASGLAYLHGLKSPIVHRDIRAKNVLLDLEFQPHITSFGLARQIESSYVSTIDDGVMGYMPPEYLAGSNVATLRGDVYSFGILMLEIATAKWPNLPIMFDHKKMRIVEWARKMVMGDRQIEMMDSCIPIQDLDEDIVKKYFSIACSCSHEIARERPPMIEVVKLLNELSM
ncbi:putative protein kinase RLK-Pelle-LRR-Xb-1 family [Rosa chinensis]|uniref:Protein kinase domain-containing protein n=1 Tax=Rosa chinensis TaxID=74649 RepID=A0A2P6Q950_ROSCH|nr:leucine-rich repeat receptor protein kinase EMS1 [Rosa chinensis]PRQ30708.1 putative protein kinase RLK-Pelle-LRR-Xb-1 family [Rosa chinensis]